MKGLMIFVFTLFAFQINAQDIVGDWNGTLSYQGMELRVVFHVTGQDGKYQSTMDSPDQGVAGAATDKTTFEDGEIKIIANALSAVYTGELSDGGDTLHGIFQQNALSPDLIPTKGPVEREAVARPQEPKYFPYQRKEVKFKNPKGGHLLAGTLTMPKDGNFNKAVILISGSGPQGQK